MNTRSNTGKYAMFAALLILALAALACSLPGTSAEPTQAPQPTAPSGSSGETQATSAAALATATPKPAEATTPPEPTDSGPEALPTIVGLDQLDSYRQTILIRMEADGEETGQISMIEEWVREPPAKHLTMSMLGLDIESIQIGDKNWVKFGDQWMESDSGSDTDPTEGLSDFDYGDSTPKYVGEETVNGVNCKHYTFDEDTEIDGENGKTTVHLTGDVWVANEPGLPTISVRMRATIDGSIFSLPGMATPTAPEKSKTYMELDVTDINQPIEINPPEM